MLSARSCCRLVADAKAVASAQRSLATAAPRRTFPQYTVYGSNCFLSLKIVLPTFKLTRANALVIDGTKGLGRVLLEWTPRDANGRGDRDSSVRFGLSPEELGVLVDQLPRHPVEFVRRQSAEDGGAMMDASCNKFIRIAPVNNSGQVSFLFDYERDGVTGVGPEGPYDVPVQLGEFKVMHELMRTSIPIVTGWAPLVDCGLQAAMNQATQEGGSNDYRANVPF